LFALVMVSSYTAQLASFLIVRPTYMYFKVRTGHCHTQARGCLGLTRDNVIDPRRLVSDLWAGMVSNCICRLPRRMWTGTVSLTKST
jgi:hypothetical protein